MVILHGGEVNQIFDREGNWGFHRTDSFKESFGELESFGFKSSKINAIVIGKVFDPLKLSISYCPLPYTSLKTELVQFGVDGLTNYDLSILCEAVKNEDTSKSFSYLFKASLLSHSKTLCRTLNHRGNYRKQLQCNPNGGAGTLSVCFLGCCGLDTSTFQGVLWSSLQTIFYIKMWLVVIYG